MFVTALFVDALVAIAALVIPTSKERLERPVTAACASLCLVRRTRPTSNMYSSNWAGAVYNSARVSATVSASLIWIAWLTDACYQGTYKSVTATFTVPTPKEPSGQSGEHSASA